MCLTGDLLSSSNISRNKFYTFIVRSVQCQSILGYLRLYLDTFVSVFVFEIEFKNTLVECSHANDIRIAQTANKLLSVRKALLLKNHT